MSVKNSDFLRERQRIGRRNLKRYWYMQSCRRLAGDKTGLLRLRETSQLHARLILAGISAVLAAIGLWGILF